jgi:phage FluMu protein Com
LLIFKALLQSIGDFRDWGSGITLKNHPSVQKCNKILNLHTASSAMFRESTNIAGFGWDAKKTASTLRNCRCRKCPADLAKAQSSSGSFEPLKIPLIMLLG